MPSDVSASAVVESSLTVVPPVALSFRVVPDFAEANAGTATAIARIATARTANRVLVRFFMFSSLFVELGSAAEADSCVAEHQALGESSHAESAVEGARGSFRE